MKKSFAGEEERTIYLGLFSHPASYIFIWDSFGLSIERVGKQIIVKQYIDREIVKYDTKFAPGGQCEIPKEFIDAHNQSAEKAK